MNRKAGEITNLDEKEHNAIIAAAKGRWPELEKDKLRIVTAPPGIITMIFPVLLDEVETMKYGPFDKAGIWPRLLRAIGRLTGLISIYNKGISSFEITSRFGQFCVELEPVGEWLMGFAIWPTPMPTYAEYAGQILVIGKEKLEVGKERGYNPPPIGHVRPLRPTPVPPTVVTKKRIK